jgi:hypothetical protein
VLIVVAVLAAVGHEARGIEFGAGKVTEPSAADAR